MNKSYGLRVSAAILLSIFLLVSWSPNILQTASGDPAYTYAYHHMFTIGTVHGRDVIHTGGPWSILYYPEFHPDTFWIMITGQIIIAFIIGWVLAEFSHAYISNAKIVWPFIIGTLTMLASAADARFFLAGFFLSMLTLNIREKNTSPIFLALIVLVACAMSIKNTFFIIGVILFLQILLTEIFYTKKLPRFAAFFFVIATGFHLIGGQPFDALPIYITSMFDMALASSEFLAEGGSVWELLSYLVLAAAFLSLIFQTSIKRDGTFGLVPSLAFSAILFISYKSGFVRQDGQHVIRAFSVLVPILLIYPFVNIACLNGRILKWVRHLKQDLPINWRGKIALYALIFCFIAGVALVFNRHTTLYANKIERFYQQVGGLLSVIANGKAELLRKHETAKAKIRKQYPLADVSGTLAVYSSLQTVGLSYGNYKVFPIAAAQMNWTPRLDAKLTSFLTGPTAPEYVFGQVPFTARKSGLALLTHYKSIGYEDTSFLMRREVIPRISQTSALEEGHLGWGDRQEVPMIKDGIVKVRIFYKPTILGMLSSFVYQPPAIVLQLFNDKNLLRQITVGREIAKSGIPLYSGPPTAASFHMLATELQKLGSSSIQTNNHVTHISLKFKDPKHWLYKHHRTAWFFDPTISVQFEKLSLIKR